MKKSFAPARQDKISTSIIRQIRSAILQGQYEPGESLPTESELVTQFGVSKHTVREALRALEGMGFITVKRGAGGGPVVSRIEWDAAREYFADFLFFQDISLAELSEVRLLLEPPMARRAAENFTPDMIEELKAVHGQCEELVRRNRSLVGAEAEIMFHVLLAKHSGNSALWIVLDFVNSILVETKRQIHPDQEFSVNVLAAHQKVLDAIIAKDGDKAEQYMREHVVAVETELMELMEQPDRQKVARPKRCKRLAP